MGLNFHENEKVAQVPHLNIKNFLKEIQQLDFGSFSIFNSLKYLLN